MAEKIQMLFLKQCVNIFRNLKDVAESILKRKSSIIFEGLVSYNYMKLMQRYRENTEMYSIRPIKEIGCIERYLDNK